MNNYILIQWPESQQYMEYDWFKNEAILGEKSSCFIPENRIIEIKGNIYILNKSKELANQLITTLEEDNIIDKNWNEALPFEGGMTIFESVLNLKLIK